MLNRRNIAIVFGFLAVLVAAILLAGCGEDTKTTSSAAAAPQCKADQKSIIPAPTGKPQHIYFFRDT